MMSRSEFQLVLLRRMADYQPGLVEHARKGLGYSVTEMRDVNARWQRFLRSRSAPRGLARYAVVLGSPDASMDQQTGDLTCRLHHWTLPLWPDLHFEIVEGPGGQVWQEWLVRAPRTQPPTPTDPGALEPWKYVVGDLERMFKVVRHLPEDAPNRWVSEYGYEDARGDIVRHRARFTYGLLQETSEAL